MELIGEVFGINGPIVTVVGCDGFHISEMVLVGNNKLVGEVIRINQDSTIVQVYEETTGMKLGEKVIGTGNPLSVVLAPGIITNIFDGIQRPLSSIFNSYGVFIDRGVHVTNLDLEKKWPTTFLVKKGDKVTGGTKIASVPESSVITHYVMIPPNISGEVVSVKPDGDYNIQEPIITVKDDNGKEHELPMMQNWPIRVSRPVLSRHPVSRPLVTGQRIIDTLFPIAKGGVSATPGAFGTGKTMTQHQLAKWSDADIICYIGCGERGNEMTQVLEEFAELVDPNSGNLLMDRTTLIANTSNMPVAAREASIYTGITIAEYYRDMGYHVAIMADSTSRWAEALRELSGRLEEMPAEEGYPAYLASRLSGFYERAGYFTSLCEQESSITIIGAVSPAGGDFSEPVTQNTKRFIRCFWSLDKSLSYARHFPAIHWLTSYSEYLDDMVDYYYNNVNEKWIEYRRRTLRLLQEESELMEIVKLIGSDVLPDSQKLVLEIAKVIRVGYLQQNAYNKVDTYCPFTKQVKMLEIILNLHEKCKDLVAKGFPMSQLKSDPLFDRIVSIKYDYPNEDIDKLDAFHEDIEAFYNRQLEENA